MSIGRMHGFWEAKIIRYSGNPGIRGGFTMQNPMFIIITWLHLSMLIDIHTPLIIPNRVPVDARYGEAINLDSLPIPLDHLVKNASYMRRSFCQYVLSACHHVEVHSNTAKNGFPNALFAFNCLLDINCY